MFVYGDVVYAQTWQILALKNCMEPFSYASTAYLVASALVSVRLFCKNLGNLQKFFGQMVYPPPPRAKNSPYAYKVNLLLYKIPCEIPPWKSMEIHGIPSIHRVPWNAMEYPWSSMECHGVP